MFRRKILGGGLAGMLLCVAQAAEARGTVPAIDYDNQVWAQPPGRQWNDEAMRQRISRAAQSSKWRTVPINDGTMLATLSIRTKHMVRVRITYTSTNFSVRYDGSEHMNHWVSSDGRNLIHPNYNLWTEQLVRAIRSELERV